MDVGSQTDGGLGGKQDAASGQAGRSPMGQLSGVVGFVGQLSVN